MHHVLVCVQRALSSLSAQQVDILLAELSLAVSEVRRARRRLRRQRCRSGGREWERN